MKRFILYTLIAFTLLSCGGSEGRFRLKGEFEHLRQGEFYIYSNDGGTAGFDTIKIEDGQFDYETDLRDHAIYYLLYPNLSEQVIFGASGDVITIKGDARNLKSVEVKGSQPNEELTAFRLENKDKGLSGTISGSASDTYYGKNKGNSRDKILSKLTTVISVVFVVLVLVSFVIQDDTDLGKIKDQLTATEAPVTTVDTKSDGTGESEGTEGTSEESKTETSAPETSA